MADQCGDARSLVGSNVRCREKMAIAKPHLGLYGIEMPGTPQSDCSSPPMRFTSASSDLDDRATIVTIGPRHWPNGQSSSPMAIPFHGICSCPHSTFASPCGPKSAANPPPPDGLHEKPLVGVAIKFENMMDYPRICDRECSHTYIRLGVHPFLPDCDCSTPLITGVIPRE